MTEATELLHSIFARYKDGDYARPLDRMICEDLWIHWLTKIFQFFSEVQRISLWDSLLSCTVFVYCPTYFPLWRLHLIGESSGVCGPVFWYSYYIVSDFVKQRAFALLLKHVSPASAKYANGNTKSWWKQRLFSDRQVKQHWIRLVLE